MKATTYYDWKSDTIRTAFGGKEKAICGAHARSTGKPCQAKAMKNGRCRNHGGLSTGPKTPGGKARSSANLKQFSTGC
jgi:hypothetical protein